MVIINKIKYPGQTMRIILWKCMCQVGSASSGA
jgi:hypothetical protein